MLSRLGDDGAALLRGLLPVEGGGQIVAAGEQEAVKGVGVALQGGGVAGEGQHHRRGAGLLQALGIAGEHPVAFQLSSYRVTMAMIGFTAGTPLGDFV